MFLRKCSILTTLFLALLFHPAFAEQEEDLGLNEELEGTVDAAPPGAVPYSLEDCIAMALHKNELIQAKQEGVEAARWRKNEASALFWPVMEYEYNMAPAPKDVSNAFNAFFEGNVTMFNRLKVGLGVPVFTFGQLSTAKQMATKGIEAATEEKYREETKVVSEVRQLYYGVQLGMELERLLEKAMDELRKRIEKEKEKQDHSPFQILKMELVLLDIEGKLIEATEKGGLAKQGLRVQMGLPDGSDLYLVATHLRPILAELAQLDDYFSVAMEYRPDARLLAAGTEAKRLQYKLEKQKWLPRAGVGTFVELGRTTDPVTGITATDDFNDPFNYTRAGVGLEIKGRLDFHGQRARVKQASREYHKTLLEKAFAKRGIRMDVEKSYREAHQAEQIVDNLEEKQRLARRMMFLAKSNYDVGLGEEGEFVEALKLLLVSRAEYFKAVFDYNSSLARLDEKIGVIPEVGQQKGE